MQSNGQAETNRYIKKKKKRYQFVAKVSSSNLIASLLALTTPTKNTNPLELRRHWLLLQSSCLYDLHFSSDRSVHSQLCLINSWFFLFAYLVLFVYVKRKEGWPPWFCLVYFSGGSDLECLCLFVYINVYTYTWLLLIARLLSSSCRLTHAAYVILARVDHFFSLNPSKIWTPFLSYECIDSSSEHVNIILKII